MSDPTNSVTQETPHTPFGPVKIKSLDAIAYPIDGDLFLVKFPKQAPGWFIGVKFHNGLTAMALRPDTAPQRYRVNKQWLMVQPGWSSKNEARIALNAFLHWKTWGEPKKRYIQPKPSPFPTQFNHRGQTTAAEYTHTPHNLPYYVDRADHLAPGWFVLAKGTDHLPFIVARPNNKPRKVRGSYANTQVRRGWHTRKEALLAMMECNAEKAAKFGTAKTNPLHHQIISDENT